MVFILPTRWRRDYAYKGRSILSIGFAGSAFGKVKTQYGSIHFYWHRLTLEWQFRPWTAEFRVSFWPRPRLPVFERSWDETNAAVAAAGDGLPANRAKHRAKRTH